MSRIIPQRTGLDRIGGLTVIVLGVYWVSFSLHGNSTVISVIRAVSGIVLLLIVPGVLSTQLFGLWGRDEDEHRTGIPIAFAVGTGFAVLSIVVVVVSAVLPAVGVPDPLDSGPFSIVMTVLIAGLWAVVARIRPDVVIVRPQLPRTSLLLGLFALLPGLAVAAAWLYNQEGNTAGMFVVIGAIAVVSALTTTRIISKRLYPLAIWAVAVALLLHRSLVTGGVIGADIQYLFFVSRFISQVGHWGPELGGSALAIPLVTAVPAAIVSVTGLSLASVFKTVFVLLYTVVPVGILYLTTELFDDDVGLYATFFFLFYHFSFYFTPGKQLISELYMVLLLLLLFRYGLDTFWLKAQAVVLCLGLAMSHYGTAYVFGTALLGGAIALYGVDQFIEDFAHNLPVFYPAFFLSMISGWYLYASTELVMTLAVLPSSIITQLNNLFTGTAFGSGASIVAGQESFIGQLNIYLYFVLTLLLCVGLFSQVYQQSHRMNSGNLTLQVEYTAVSVFFFLFLGSSYFLIVNLYADRAYQMTLPVLAAFVPLGVASLYERVEIPSFTDTIGPRWPGLLSLLLVLLLLNSGFALAVAGLPERDYTFDTDANDYVYSAAEREAGAWLVNQSDIQWVGPLTDTSLDSTERVPIYTDIYTYQMLRSSVPPDYYSTELVAIKNRWHPTFDAERISGGYVVIRGRAVTTAEADDEVGLGYLKEENVNQLKSNRTVVFSNKDITILGPSD